MGRHAIRILTERGWEQLGKDRFEHVEPAPPNVSADPGGFAGCSFVLPRPDALVPQPDIGANAECEIDFDGIRIFEGRVSEAPVSGPERLITVQGRGLQYALDENPLVRLWAMSDMTQWKDARTGPQAVIWTGTYGLGGAGLVTESPGLITIGYPRGSPWPAGATVGVTCDFGADPRRWPAFIAFIGEKGSGDAKSGNIRLYCRNHDDAGGFEDPSGAAAASREAGINELQPTLLALTAGRLNYRGDFAVRRRYVTIYLKNDGATYTTVSEDSLTLSSIVTFFDRDDRYGGQSAIRMSTVALDVFDRTPGLATPIIEPEEFADEAQSQAPFMWFRGRASDVGTGVEKYNLRVAAAAPLYDQSPGPLTSGEASVFAAFDGVDDGLVFSAASIDELGIFVLFRTSQAAPAGTVWPAGRGLVSAETVAAGDADYGITFVAGGKISAGVLGGAAAAATHAKVVNDGQWHTAFFKRSRFYVGGVAQSILSLIIDGDLATETFATETGASGGQPLAAADVYIGRTINAGNYFDVDVAEMLWIPARLPTTSIALLHASALARVRGTVKRTLLRLPEFHTPVGAAKTPRNILDEGNMYHRYRIKVGRDRMPWFYPQPSVPKYALTDDAVEHFTDTSPSAAQDNYNRVLVLGTRPDGANIAVFRHAADLPGARLDRAGQPTFPNPGAEVDASGWLSEATSGIALARVTSGQRSGAGGFRIPATTASTSYWRGRAAIDGFFIEGYTYVIGGYYRLAAGFLGLISDTTAQTDTGKENAVAAARYLPSPQNYIAVIDEFPPEGGTTDWARLDWQDNPTGAFASYRPFAIAFTAPYTTEFGALRIQMAYADFYFDDLWIARSLHHRLDRLGQVRTRTMEFGQNIDIPTAQTLADAFLVSKLRTPFAGSLPIGPGDLVTYGQNPQHVPPAALVDNVGELVHFPGLIDPDGLGPGRDGQIAGVSFDCATEVAQTSFDNTRDNLEALMARGALLSGSS